MSGILEILKAWGMALANIFGYAKDKQTLNNTPEMKKANEAQKNQEKFDKITEDTAKGDDESIRNNLSH